MNIKTAVKRMEDLEDNFICFSSQLDIAIMNGWEGQKIRAINNISHLRKNAKEIYDEIGGGCYKFNKTAIKHGTEYFWCGKDGIMKLCPNCQEIKRIYDALHAVSEPGVKNG